MVLIFTFSLDKRTGTRFIFSPETETSDNIYETIVFRHWSLKAVKGSNPERRNTNEMSPTIALADAWREIPDCSSGRKSSGRAQRFP